MIDPIVNSNFGNTFHHQNRPNQRQHSNKNPARNIITAPLDNSISTETLAKNIILDIIVNNIKPDTSKYIEHLQYQTLKKMFYVFGRIWVDIVDYDVYADVVFQYFCADTVV